MFALFVLTAIWAPPLIGQSDETAKLFHVVPHIADGGGLQSLLLVTNVSESASPCTLQLSGLDMQRFEEASGVTVDDSTATFYLEGPGGALIWRTKNESALAFGYATLECVNPVTVQVVFMSLDDSGVPTGMATVFKSQSAKVFQYPILTPEASLGFSIANDTNDDASCNLVLRDPDLVNLDDKPLTVPAKSSVASFLFESIDIPADFTEGSTTVSCDQRVSTIGLHYAMRSDGDVATFTTLPPSILSADPAANDSPGVGDPQSVPNLTVIEVMVTGDGTPAPGAQFTLSATVRNHGDGAAAATTLRYYRSTNSTITSADTSVGTDSVGALSAGSSSSESIGLTAPATAGTYYYGACVDSVTGESDTGNNCSKSVQVDVSAPTQTTSPDLTVGSPSVSDSSPATGGSFTLSATVRNRGDGAAAATTLRYYRSTDSTITSADTSVGTDSVGALSAGSSSSESIGLTAPATAGTYYYGACVDSVTGESDTGNNCSSSVRVDVSAPPPSTTSPDLTVGSPSVSDSSPATGGSFTLSATVRNRGDGAAAATTLRYYRSTDSTITSADTSVGTDSVAALSAGSSNNESISLTAPATAGTYYYGACVDSVTGESNTGNNCSSSVRVDVSAPPPSTSPDLTVGSPSVSDSSPATGGSFTLSATVRNRGDGAAAATTLRYYRSTDSAITSADISVGTDSVAALSAGSSNNESISLTAPATAGTYYYGACVDSVTGESNTGNNCSSSVRVDVSAPPPSTSPDLTVGSPSVSDSSPATGGSFTLSATVRNRGDGAAAATTLRYYRSTDSAISSADSSVGTDSVGALSAGSSSSESIALTAPTTAGTYYYGACVDSVTGESNTGNNCSSSVRVDVSAPPPSTTSPDLVPSGIVFISSPNNGLRPGQTIRINSSVRNKGDGAAAATTLRYYRSTDSTISSADTSLGTRSIPALGAGESTGATTISTKLPSTPGTYYFGACVDSVTGESNTGNNCSGAAKRTIEEE